MSQYKPQCIRSVANWTKVTKEHKFEKPTFNREQFLKDLPSFSPKLKELLDKIEELDAHDMKTENRTFKHFIFSDVKIGGTGAKIVASGLIAKGFNLAYDKKLKLASDEELLKTKKKNFILLASTSIYNGNISAGLKKQLLAKYNERPANVYGNLARIIVMDSGFKEGIDLFDVKYVHIFEPQTSKADQKQVIGRATRTCGQRGLVFHPTQGWPLKVFIYDVNIPKELRERFLHTDPDQTHIDSLFNLYMESTGIDLRKLTLADELEKVAIVGAVDYELNKPVHRFEIEDETEYGRLFDGGAQPISQPQPVDKPVNCQAKACGNIRANKHVPVSTALLTTVAISIGEKLPKIQKGESPRSFYCKLLKTNPDFCKRVQEANKDPVGYVQRNSDKILAGIKKKLYTGLRQSQKGAFLRLVFSVIPRPTIVKRMKKEDKAPSPVPETSPNTQSESLKSRSASPVARSVTPSVPASPTSSSSSNATQNSKSTSQSTESRSLSRSRSRSLSESMKESPQTPEQIMQELDKEMSYPRPPLVATPDFRKNNFLKIRNHVRENFMEYAWPKVKLENLCGYGGENLPLNKESPQEGGAEIMNYTPTQAFVSEYFTPENPMKGMLLMHSVGTGKCFKKDTAILMYDGSIKKVQDIQVGDVVMGDDSTPRNVLTLGRGIDDMYDIIPIKGDKYTVNSEHILCLKWTGLYRITHIKRQPNTPYKVTYFDNKTISLKSKSFPTKELAQVFASKFTDKDRTFTIEVKDYLKLSNSLKRDLKGYRVGVEFSHKPVDIDPYFLGLWLGDGTSRDPKISTADKEVLSYITSEAAKYGLVVKHEKKYDYRISSLDKKTGSNKLKKYNVRNNKHIPDEYLVNNRSNRLRLLAGILDTDGSYDSKGKGYDIIQKNTKLANQIVYLARSLGFAAYMKKSIKSWTYKGVKKQDVYNRISVSGKGLEDIPVLIKRKIPEKRIIKKDALLTGITVKHVGRDNYYGFTLDNNHKFLLGDFTVTHNTCTGIATASKSFEKQGYTILWVTRTTLKSDIWKNMFDQVCSESIKEKINKGQEIPATHSDRMRLLSKSWAIRPMSYKQFSNLVAGKNQLYQDLVKINGKEDPLRKTLLIIDEAHKLYGGEDLSSVERPDMKKLHQAIMKSYVTSGKDSVRVLLMTATPITNDAFELIKLLNLLRGPKEQLPEEYETFSSNFLDTEGKFTKKGKFSFLNEIAGHISYLDRSKDARQFSQPQIQLVSTPMSTINESIYDEIEDAANIINDVNEQLVNMKTAKSTIKKKYSQLKKEEKGRCKGLKKEALSECRETSQKTLQNLIKQEEDEVIESEAKLNSLKADKATNKSRIQKLKKEIKSDSSQLATIRLKCPKPKPRAKKTKAPTSS